VRIFYAQANTKSKETFNMKIKLLIAFASIITLIAGAMSVNSLATTNKGAANIEINGGKRGNVPFPHHQHQARIGDCQICHSVFAQKSGSINELKAEGTLKKKYVMNKLCTKCHKANKKAGRKSGPTTCKKCHIKAKTSN